MAHAARVLIANGDLNTLKRVSECMRRLGFVNLLETDAAKAINRAQTERPEVILLGLDFNGRDGASIISDIKAEVATRDIPLFLTCGENQAPAWFESWVARFDGVML